ncbi:hypothetical protein GCM10012275_10360 [Longimycelium tulufanense]|uniref:Alkylmercury lyase n=1 Tax=Longimycelium tulufanense TaxID=907463 RepID=A0A8J3C9W3_9PSEU|nr:organomercurial lyase [Longimycelium tulufanense]GGM41279.1 hypothetical protein GCM10012275_10360 [Longimycelium tulufanense]
MTEMHDLAALSGGGTADRQATLPAPLRELHQRVLRHFLVTGAAPTMACLREAAGFLGLDVGDAVTTLANADLVHTDDHQITVAYPFSGTPTPHVVAVNGCSTVHAMCAIDALGVPPMTGRDGTITSADVYTGARVHVEHHAGQWYFTPEDVAILMAQTGQDGPSSCCTCPHINFHISPLTATAYLAARPDLHGVALDQRRAIALATHLFGPLLRQ